jgi:site-specific DNA-methyltransferase (adenine-specific)
MTESLKQKNMLINDHFQNYKRYGIPKCQLLIADVPYNLGNNAYASNPAWYKDGDNSNGESELAGKSFFDTDTDFRPAEFMHFCSTMLKSEKKANKAEKVEGEARQKGDAPCMVLFCAFDQQMYFIELAKKYGLNKYINLVFRKNFSAQVLKANMKIVGNCEYGLVLYRDKLPKFNNEGKMIFNCMDWPRDNESEKIHPCLPSGEKVYFNNEWKNIEDVKNRG